MRPHFIYNTLLNIYCLCEQNPGKARQVTLDFTNYLRKNFTAIASENPIPFSAELEHTYAYLGVAEAQFEELLQVEYDVPHTRFRVPPLTLQPIVENAVKYGINPDAGALHVTIQFVLTTAIFFQFDIKAVVCDIAQNVKKTRLVLSRVFSDIKAISYIKKIRSNILII